MGRIQRRGREDATGSLIGFRGTDRDITERRRLEGELVKAQKLEAIGTLAGGIAHDFNNLLQGLFGYISLAKLNLGRRDKAEEMLEQAEKALTLSVNLTTQLLTFAKGGKPVKRRIALPAILEDSAKFALSGSRSDYRLAVDQDLWSVDADDGQLSQVIQNLVLNASEAMPRGARWRSPRGMRSSPREPSRWSPPGETSSGSTSRIRAPGYPGSTWHGSSTPISRPSRRAPGWAWRPRIRSSGATAASST